MLPLAQIVHNSRTPCTHTPYYDYYEYGCHVAASEHADGLAPPPPVEPCYKRGPLLDPVARHRRRRPHSQPHGHLMSTHRPARTTAQRRAHRRPKPTVERLSRAARSSVTVPCSSTATLQDAWCSFMMALQPADAPAPAVCSLVALEGHDGRERSSGLSATHSTGTLCERHGEIFQISRRPKGQELDRDWGTSNFPLREHMRRASAR